MHRNNLSESIQEPQCNWCICLKQALPAEANGKRPVGRPRTRLTNYIEDLRWNRFLLHQS